MSNSLSGNNSSTVVQELYRLYLEEKKSPGGEYSSHWKERIADVDIEYSSNGIVMNGRGFGEFNGIHKERSLYYRLKNIPNKLFIRRMLKKSNPDHIAKSKKIISSMEKVYTYDDARMVLTVGVLSQFIEELNSATVVIIGDGYGELGCLLKAIFPRVRIIQINLGEVLIFDAHYTGKAYPDYEHKLVNKNSPELCKDFNYVEAGNAADLNIQADVFINTVSMAEMTLNTVHDYFKIFRSQKSDSYFYCCNRLSKQHPDGYVCNFADYGWLESDHVLLDELCPWHQKAPRNRPPFYYRFDGPIQHKLILIEPSIAEQT